jgi:hypothetical protein
MPANISETRERDRVTRFVSDSNDPSGAAPPRARRPWSRLAGGRIRDHFWLRVASIVVLSGIGYAFVFADLFTEILGGSRTAYLAAVPVLVLLIVLGYRTRDEGVGDFESDWIVAALVGVAGLIGIHLFSQRGPTTAALWHLDLVGAALWIACCGIIVSGSRRVFQAWPAGLFMLCTMTPLPYHLAVAQLGGTDFDAALVVVAMGAFAVFVSGHARPLLARMAATAATLVLGGAAAAVLADRVSLPVLVLIVGNVVPVLCAAPLLPLRADSERPVPATTRAPVYRSTKAMLLMVVSALAVLAMHPMPQAEPEPPTVSADWIGRAGLVDPTPIPFITDFLGPDATLTRYTVPVAAGPYPAVVDVMTSPSLARLDDFTDAVWYPSAEPLNYRPAEADLGAPAGARVLYNDPDIAISDSDEYWYAVTWLWRTPEAYQRVTVLVNQSRASREPPPLPRPLSVKNTLIDPTLWLLRHQSTESGEVGRSVVNRAAQVVRAVTHGAGQR